MNYLYNRRRAKIAMKVPVSTDPNNVDLPSLKSVFCLQRMRQH